MILIEKCPELDYRMYYYNADGSQSLCGNGSRCGFAFAQSLEIVGQSAAFETTDGAHKIKSEGDEIHFQIIDIKAAIETIGEDQYLDTGSPHYIVWVDDLDHIDVVKEGRKIRNRPYYSARNGVNVNFVQILDGRIRMRTYERGVENETLSCGTGAVAVALAAKTSRGYESPIMLETKGGILNVYFSEKADRFSDIWLAGSAEKVFEGSIDI